ncbi:hypothetical protein [Pararhodospirillum photometricum]|uniref:Uncharacterized protein n=1 Tax=Pararhodospirillum photometricum DSM 122 TaxID=1150469 RepID=H6SR80_PARPM|nr:hypothetical protein [Pararhodospirillum photometricum]CCG09802.1 unnamed protein product [Pararhodospirillum photometricum DSM 122]
MRGSFDRIIMRIAAALGGVLCLTPLVGQATLFDGSGFSPQLTFLLFPIYVSPEFREMVEQSPSADSLPLAQQALGDLVEAFLTGLGWGALVVFLTFSVWAGLRRFLAPPATPWDVERRAPWYLSFAVCVVLSVLAVVAACWDSRDIPSTVLSLLGVGLSVLFAACLHVLMTFLFTPNRLRAAAPGDPLGSWRALFHLIRKRR